MKTFSPGLCDSIAGVLDEPSPCPHCQSSSHIAGGLCVGCLLEAGLDPADDAESETLTDILAEVRLPDQNWRLGNYEILEEIGRGGMGVIYRARQRHSRRIVAVKRVLSYHADSRETLARFRREAQAAASLDHPNILPIFEVSESEDGLPFFSMKFAPGGTLQQVAPALRKEPRQCVALVAKITRAVQYAHGRGILHRDLKPGNILLDARGEPFVSDFGLAKWLDTSSDLTRTLTIFGTPGYIAPEQASASAADLKPTADVYSLGAILFDLLAGRPPFLGAHALSVIRQAAELPAPKLRTLSKLADRDLETICSRCLERDPKLRYPSAHDLAEDLERWLEGRSIIARPVLPPVRMWRWSRRNPWLAGSALLAVLLAGVALFENSQSLRLGTTLRDDQAVRHSIAVLPFLDLDTARQDLSLSRAIARSLGHDFSGLGPARVTLLETRGTEFRGADAQDAPDVRGVRTVLAGAKRILGNKVHISVRLLDGAHGDVLYQTEIALDLTQTFGPEVSHSIAAPIYKLLSAQDWSEIKKAHIDPVSLNSDARDFLTSGRELLKTRTTIGLRRAAESFRKATEVEPASALSFALLATAQAAITQIEPSVGMIRNAEASAHKAVELNNRLGEAHRALGMIFFLKGDYNASVEELFASIEMDGATPGSAARIAGIVRMLGRPDRALGWCELSKAQALPADVDNLIGDCWSDLGVDDRAEAAYRRVSQFRPELPDGWMGLCRLRLLQRNFTEADEITVKYLSQFKEYELSQQMTAQVHFFARHYAKAEELYMALAASEPDGGSGGYGGLSYASVLGQLRMLANDEVAARKILQKALEDESSLLKATPHSAIVLYRLAAISASQQQTEVAVEYLEKAFREGWIDHRSTMLDPRFDGLAKNPRFKSLIANVTERTNELRAEAIKPQ